jgi:hypothetical protein
MVKLSNSWLALSFAALSASARIPVEKRNDTASYSANLLSESMNWMDMYYDSERGYLFSLDAAALTRDRVCGMQRDCLRAIKRTMWSRRSRLCGMLLGRSSRTRVSSGEFCWRSWEA